MQDRRFEDKLSIQDLSKMKQKDIIIMTYMQAVKTNGQVAESCADINTLQADVKDKIGIKELNRMQKLFAWVTGGIGFIVILFNVFDRVAQYTGG